MTGAFSDILARFGQEFELYSRIGGEYVLSAVGRAFIQPMAGARGYLEPVPTELGRLDEGRYLYLGPSDVDISPAREGYLFSEGEKYSLLRSERIRLGEGVFHVWGMLRKAEELL